MNDRVRIVSLLLLVSGMCALVFQTAWLREFRLIFGSTTPASAAVLAIFMGGLGLGNALLGKRADASANPLLWYGQLEMAISAAAIVSPFLVGLVRQIYFALGGQETLGTLGATAVRLLLATLVIGVPTFLMGGTMPAAARAAIGAGDESRRGVGWLYGLNTLGAVLGAVLGTFVLLERLGTRETLWAASAVNLLNSCFAYWLSQRWSPASGRVQGSGFGVQEERKREKAKRSSGGGRKPAETVVAVAKESEAAIAEEAAAAISPKLLFLAAGVVGFAFFLMELVWYRMLGPILGGTTFTFGLILAVALAGIGIGGALYPLLYRGRAATLRDLALSCGAEALAIAIPLALGDRLAILALSLQGLRYFGFAGQIAAWTVICLIVIFPAAVISGVQFPLLVSLLGRGQRDVGKHLGQAFAWNTAGAILGALSGGFGLLSLATAPGAWKLCVILLAALSVVLLLTARRGEQQPLRMLPPLAVNFAAAICLFAVGPTAVWRHSGIGAGRANPPSAAGYNAMRDWAQLKRRMIAWETDGAEASVAISRGNAVAFLVNGKSDGDCVGDAGTQIMFPMIGAMLHPDPRECLVIGLGTGESAGWLAALPMTQRVDVAEIEPAIARVAQECALLNHNVLAHPKVHVAFNDAREVVQTTRRQYDLIASEPSNPYRAGVASLYTRDFYEAARQRLKPGGLFVQWLQGYEIDIPTVRMVLATLHGVFPHVEVWEAKPDDLVLVCSADPLSYDLARLQSRVELPAVREALRVGWRTTRVEGVLAHYVAGEKYVAAVAQQPAAEVNTDNQNLLEYSFARSIVPGAAGPFTVAGLREEARQLGDDRPAAISGDVDWEAVADQRLAYLAAIGDAQFMPQGYTGDRGHRAVALANFDAGNGAGITASWELQSKPPFDLIETLALAWGYAELGDESKARPLIERLRPDGAIEAMILEADLLHQQKQHEAAADKLIAAFVAMRSDATVLRRVGEHAMRLAAEIVDKDEQQSPRLNEALSQPLAVLLLNEMRLRTRCYVAKRASLPAAAAAIAELEPHVPWDYELLKLRQEAYQAIKDSREAIATRDLMLFQFHAPDAQVLTQIGRLDGAGTGKPSP